MWAPAEHGERGWQRGSPGAAAPGGPRTRSLRAGTPRRARHLPAAPAHSRRNEERIHDSRNRVPHSSHRLAHTGGTYIHDTQIQMNMTKLKCTAFSSVVKDIIEWSILLFPLSFYNKYQENNINNLKIFGKYIRGNFARTCSLKIMKNPEKCLGYVWLCKRSQNDHPWSWKQTFKEVE